MRYSLVTLTLVVCTVLITPRQAYAIRPFVTDDARVVGKDLAQIESWLVGDNDQLSHNVLGAIGPTDWLEITTGFVHGGIYNGADSGYSITGPIFQLKGLVHESKSNALPGLAFAMGVVPPFGSGSFTPKGVSMFGYMALTESLFNEDLLLHANLGFAAADERTNWIATHTAGFGFQARIVAGLHTVAEVYYGDPYDPVSATGKSQFGFRYIVNNNLQFDGTAGKNIEGDSELWWTLGIRLVSSSLF